MSDHWDIPEQDRAAAVLQQATDRGDLGHAWAFVGPPGVGQTQAARTFAAAANDALGHPVDHGRFMRGAHPAYREFLPVGAFHRKEDVHGLWLDAANTTLKEGSVKVLRVVSAERMNDNAANAFLKALEEPPPGTIWVIDLADPDEVPDTILSRCRVVTFSSWSRQALADLGVEQGLAPDDAALAARVAMGSPEAMRRLAQPGALDDYRLHRTWVGQMRDQGPGFALRATAALKDEISRRTKAIDAQGAEELDALSDLYGTDPPKGVTRDLQERFKRLSRAEQTLTLQQALDDVASWCRDVVVVSRGGGADVVRNADVLDDLAADAERFSTAALLDISDRALHAREAMEVNVRWDLTIEAFLLGAHARVLAD